MCWQVIADGICYMFYKCRSYRISCYFRSCGYRRTISKSIYNVGDCGSRWLSLKYSCLGGLFFLPKKSTTQLRYEYNYTIRQVVSDDGLPGICLVTGIIGMCGTVW